MNAVQNFVYQSTACVWLSVLMAGKQARIHVINFQIYVGCFRMLARCQRIQGPPPCLGVTSVLRVNIPFWNAVFLILQHILTAAFISGSVLILVTLCNISGVIYLTLNWCPLFTGQFSVVGMLTRYGLDGPWIESQWRYFLRSTWLALEPTHPPIQWVPGHSRG
jgi:hypothetical protein